MQSIDNEQKLISGILKADEKFLHRFYHQYGPKLLSFISRKISLKEDAEEILQDTLLSSLDALRDFRYQCSLSTYLHAIASKKIIDFYRKKQIKKILFSRSPELQTVLTTLFNPEEEFDVNIRRFEFATALKSLKPMHQKILKLKYFNGYSVKQIKKDLCISFKSAESLLFRARRALAAALAYE